MQNWFKQTNHLNWKIKTKARNQIKVYKNMFIFQNKLIYLRFKEQGEIMTFVFYV